MKIWVRIIDRTLREETRIGDEQFVVMSGRGTTDDILIAAMQVIEEHREMPEELHVV